MRIYSEGKKDSNGSIIISPGWVYTPDDEEIETYTFDDFHFSLAKATSNWISGPVKGWMNKNGHDPETNSPGTFIDSNKLRDLIIYVEFTDLIDFSTAKNKIFHLLINNFTEETVWEMMERLNMFDKVENNDVEKMINEVLAKYPDKIVEYKSGKVGLISLFMGDAMKIFKGKVNAKEVKEMLENKLK